MTGGGKGVWGMGLGPAALLAVDERRDGEYIICLTSSSERQWTPGTQKREGERTKSGQEGVFGDQSWGMVSVFKPEAQFDHPRLPLLEFLRYERPSTGSGVCRSDPHAE